MASSEKLFQRALQAITFGSAEAALPEGGLAGLKALRSALRALPREVSEESRESLLDCLEAREREMERGLKAWHEDHLEQLAGANLKAEHSFQVLFARTCVLDALHRFAFEVASEELPLLVRLRILEGEKELESRKEQLPRKLEALQQTRTQASAMAGDATISPPERAYYERVRDDQAREVEEVRQDIQRLETTLPVWKAFRTEPGELEQRMVLFARGGYGRAEMSLASDVDTGWCVETEGLPAGAEAVFQEAIMRTERLLGNAGVETAHQYFETGEELSRFTEPETMHTIPSVLEGRVILGKPAVLGRLKEKFFAVLPYEDFLKKKIAEFEGQGSPSLTEMDLKEDAGGLRTIQIPLWILGVTYRAESFMTADLVRMARERGLLSVWQAARYVRALELLYELRNFGGFAERYYYDEEARAGNFQLDGFPPNRISDGLARLYLFRKGRFPSLDRLDAYRLRLASDVRGISAALLEKILDRTITHSLGGFGVAVHLGRKKITGLLGGDGKATDNPVALLGDGEAMLRLFAFIARNDYDLSDGLKDRLAEAVANLALPREGPPRAALAALLSEIMAAPHAQRALETMLEISDPLAPSMDSLLGRFIPEYDDLAFLVRDPKTAAGPFHHYLLECVKNGQDSLEWLRREYPEMHMLLGPVHVLALKWALLLHGLGRISGPAEDASQTAERAAETLGRLGYEDDALEGEVRLLIQHHQTMLRLSRTAAYFDQALVEFFDIAGRDIVGVILLFLVNRSVLLAGPYRSRGDVANLERFFAETGKILAEVRGGSESSPSLELINEYLYRKKEELRVETRVYQLLQKAITFGLERAVYEPLREAGDEVWERLEPHTGELDALQRDVVLGERVGHAHERLVGKLAQQLRNHLGREVIARLTMDEEAAFSWFFSAFPNRYLLTTPPQKLAAQVAQFAGFREAQVRAEVIAGARGAEEALLIYTRGLENSHARVAYMLSRKRINLISGKINPVRLTEGEQTYCYYFQITPLAPGQRLFPRELEQMIRRETPPDLQESRLDGHYSARGTRVEFLGDDGKGYLVAAEGEGFKRRAAGYGLVRVVLRDEPYLFYKVIRVFDIFGAEVQQSLITTIGNQVVDYFYLLPEAYERLKNSAFEERLRTLIRADLV